MANEYREKIKERMGKTHSVYTHEVGYSKERRPLPGIFRELAREAIEEYEEHLIRKGVPISEEEVLRLRKWLENKARQKIKTRLKVTFKEMDKFLGID